MKFRQLNKWENKDDLCDLIYFAQLLEELLFDYSLDTYKPSAMNTSLLCIEALTTLDEVEKNSIQKANLRHVTKELSINISKDSVAKSLLTLDIDRIISILNNKTAPLSETKILLELMWSEIRLDKYKERNEELIYKAIIENKGKDLIRALTRSYITTLRNFGYSAKFLYEETLAFFITVMKRSAQRRMFKNTYNYSTENFRNTQQYIGHQKSLSLFLTLADR